MNKPIQVTNSSMPNFEDFTDEIKDLWESGWLTNSGKKHQKLELELCKYLDISNISLFANGHLALEYVLTAFNLSGEVITTPFTFASTTHAIVRNGLTPVFCDINPVDFTIDTDQIEKLITDKTTAIVPVHVYGNVCNIKEIERIANIYNLKVIYDAAHAFGVKINDQSIANFGDASMFSFHATKVFNSIEGGAVAFKEPNLSPILKSYKNFGITGPESIDYIGGNGKMNEFQAAMGLCNLRNIDEEINKRKIVFERYIENLEGTKGIKLLQPQKAIKRNYSYFPIVLDGYWNSRNKLHEHLKINNVFARKYFYPLTNRLSCYEGRFNKGKTPIAEHIAEKVLTLPLYADLALEDVDQICKIIKS
ncbi:DegT/DnrJ/EryC1/StrS family aminotransferase [Thalassorhabdus alkalitolerans]